MLLDGKEYRRELLEEYREYIEKNKLDITLAIIQVGDNKASNLYVGNKIKYCNKVGIKTNYYHLKESTREYEVEELIRELNDNDEITGILLQSPTPKHIIFDNCAELIVPHKDVDGFTKQNIYDLYMNNESILPCTVKGIIKLLEHYDIDVAGKKVTIIGRGNIVGKPLALALINRNATVCLCHSKTKDLSSCTKDADIVVSAAGKAGLVTSDMVKDGFVGVDVGINYVDDKLVGDFGDVYDKASYITPVPGGVGPMTIAMIIDNLIEMKESRKVLKR